MITTMSRGRREGGEGERREVERDVNAARWLSGDDDDDEDAVARELHSSARAAAGQIQ